MSNLQEFLAGERPEDVALFLADDYLDESGRIADHGQAVDGGTVLVVPGDTGRQLFQAGTGLEAMQFAKAAMQAEGDVDAGLNGGTCPESGDGGDGDHRVQFVLAFAEEQNEEAGGVYAEGDVVHAYAHCECGTDFSDRWVVDP